MTEVVRSLIVDWRAWVLAALLLGALVRVWQLGRGQRFRIPAGWVNRLGAVALLALAAAAGLGLYLILVSVGHNLEAGIDPDADLELVSTLLDKPAADLPFLQVADNAPRALRDLRGKVVVLNLWATWCHPCREELPALNRLQSTYAGRGLQVVTLSDETPAPLRKFAAQHPFQTLNVYTSRLGWLNVPVRPVILVIDREGTVRRAVIGGPRSYEKLVEMIRPYMVAG